MRVTSKDLNNPQEAGEYPFAGILIRVEAKHIRVWREHPEFAFEIGRSVVGLGKTAKRHRLQWSDPAAA